MHVIIALIYRLHVHVHNAHWFEYPLLFGTLVPHFLEQLRVLREDVGMWYKVKLSLANPRLETREVPPESILAANLKRPREVVELCVVLVEDTCK